MKNLKDLLNESLIVESKTIEIPYVYGLDMDELMELCKTFDFNTKDEEEWAKWDDVNIDSEFAMKNKPLLKKLAKTVEDLDKVGINIYTKDLGNFPYDDSHALKELLSDEFDAEKGEYFAFLTGDGDNGYFLVLSSKKPAGIKAIDNFIKLIECSGGWGWETVTYDPED